MSHTIFEQKQEDIFSESNFESAKYRLCCISRPKKEGCDCPVTIPVTNIETLVAIIKVRHITKLQRVAFVNEVVKLVS